MTNPHCRIVNVRPKGKHSVATRLPNKVFTKALQLRDELEAKAR